MIWNEENCLDIIRGELTVRENIIYDIHGEELSFPAIYSAVVRDVKAGVRATPFKLCMFELIGVIDEE